MAELLNGTGSLDVTDSGNDTRWPENMTSSQLNDSARALEGMLARYLKDSNGSVAVAGTDTYTATINADTGFALYDGFVFCGDFANANTGAATLNLTPHGGSALGAKSIVKLGGTALASGDIAAGMKVLMVYDGTNFQMITPVANVPTSGISNVVEDTTPQLGGTLDCNNFAIDMAEGSNVASHATTADPWAALGNTVHITGTTNITDFADADAAGQWRYLIFDDVLTITDGSGITINNGGNNFTTAAGDIGFLYADSTTAFRLIMHKVSGEAAGGATKEMFVLAANRNGNDTAYNSSVGDFAINSLGSTSTVLFVWHVPNDFTSITDLVVVSIPDASETIQYDLTSDYAASGQAYTTHSESSLNATDSATLSQILESDASGVFSSMAAGDYCALTFASDTDNLRVIGLRFRYS